MLAGVPHPEGFDIVALQSGDGIRDRYQLGAQVAGAVACAWIEQWVDARRAGDHPPAPGRQSEPWRPHTAGRSCSR